MQDIPDTGESESPPQWAPEHVVDRDRARRLIQSQFSRLDSDTIELLGEGWDHTVWAVEGRWAFRFPRRAIVLPGLERSTVMLARIAPHLPAQVPVPEFLGRPEDDYPWPFVGGALIDGGEVADTDLGERQRRDMAAPVAAFLRALHAIDPAVASGVLEVDPMGRTDMAVRVPIARDHVQQVEAAGIWTAPPAVEALFDVAVRLGPSETPVIVHGDLHARHLLVSGGDLTGVIDWDDVCLADPASDLSLYWSVLTPPGRAIFREAYGELSQAQLVRARVLAVFLCSALALYADDLHLPNLRAEAVAGLDRAVSE